MLFQKSNLYRTTSKQWKLLDADNQSVIIDATNFYLAQYGAFAFKAFKFDPKTKLKFKIKLPGKTIYKILKRKIIKRKWYNPLGWFTKIKQALPLTRKVYDQTTLFIEIKKPFLFFYLKKNYHKEIKVDQSFLKPPSFKYDPNASFISKIDEKPFADPFTKIATEYFQTIDKPFTPAFRFRDSHIVVFEKEHLWLKNKKTAISNKTNQTTVAYYKDYMTKIYGQEKLSKVQYRFNINLDQMIQKSAPLMPEHIYRINIGVNNIEMMDVEALYFKLFLLKKNGKDLPSNLEKFYSALTKKYNFTLRECRNLKRVMGKKTLKEFLDEIFSSKSLARHVYEMPRASFNLIVGLLLTPRSCFDLALTGKKIIHKAIMGYYTIGNKIKFKPWLDLHELLQIFLPLQNQNNWNDFFELLSHVVVKKHLIRQHPTLNWSVGALIPGPDIIGESKRWFYVDSWTDDNHGDFNYTLVPAYKETGKSLAIKLYRSTAANSYNMFSWNTIAADLTTAKAPGAGKHTEADSYELPFFLKRTIPVWVGYYLLANKKVELPDSLNLKQPLIFALNYFKSAILSLPATLKKILNFPLNYFSDLQAKNLFELQEVFLKLNRQFYTYAKDLKELPEDKITEDIAFVGHSLGGAFAQGCFCHFSAYYNRIPVPGCKFICYSSDPPAITNKGVSFFWQFIERHQEVIKVLNQNWQIILQLEYGDPVSQTGESHLIGLKKITFDFIELKIQVFKPLKTATAKSITTAPTHGRRISQAKEDKDFKLTPLTPLDIYNYNHAFLLTKKQSQLFGFVFFKSPKTFEGLRRAVSHVISPFKKPIKKIWQWIYNSRGKSLRDKNGHAFVSYKSTSTLPMKSKAIQNNLSVISND